MIALALLSACSGPRVFTNPHPEFPVPTPTTDYTPVDTGSSTAVVDTAFAWHGTIPASPIPPPAFEAVVNRDGTARGPSNLQGVATALWFYPQAFTGG